jgi:hypothetical protein
MGWTNRSAAGMHETLPSLSDRHMLLWRVTPVVSVMVQHRLLPGFGNGT